MPRTDRARPSLHRPAAALQGHARQVRALSEGRARTRRTIWSPKARPVRHSRCIRANASRAPISTQLIAKARAAVSALSGFPPHYPRFVLEQAAIAGALNPDVLADPARAAEAANYIARRLDMLSDETERGWHGEPTADGGLALLARRARRARGRRYRRPADRKRRCAQARRMATDLQPAYLKAGTLIRKDESREIRAPVRAARAPSSNGAARAWRCSATRVWAR